MFHPCLFVCLLFSCRSHGLSIAEYICFLNHPPSIHIQFTNSQTADLTSHSFLSAKKHFENVPFMPPWCTVQVLLVDKGGTYLTCLDQIWQHVVHWISWGSQKYTPICKSSQVLQSRPLQDVTFTVTTTDIVCATVLLNVHSYYSNHFVPVLQKAYSCYSRIQLQYSTKNFYSAGVLGVALWDRIEQLVQSVLPLQTSWHDSCAIPLTRSADIWVSLWGAGTNFFCFKKMRSSHCYAAGRLHSTFCSLCSSLILYALGTEVRETGHRLHHYLWRTPMLIYNILQF